MAEIEIFSPAKINLTLAITGRREDGFHNLASLVVPLAFGDDVRIKTRPERSGIVLATSNENLPVDAGNIAWRAADLFLKTFGIRSSVDIEIRKRIPIGAGLGGGSSNGSAVLRGLSQLFEIDDSEAISNIAAKLGSDCPLFLQAEPLIMRGRGDAIERLDPDIIRSLAGMPLALFKPSFGISTAWAYRELAASPHLYASASQTESELEQWKQGKRSLDSLLMNSFSSVVGQKYPSIPLILESIQAETGSACLMSGSGSSCFALCKGSEMARIRSIVSEKWGKSAFFGATRILDI